MAINKEEMSAFNKVLRTQVLPKSKEMSKRAIKKYEKENGKITAKNLEKNFSQILTECVQIETDLFKELSAKITQEWMNKLLGTERRNQLFPTISQQAELALDVQKGMDAPDIKLGKIISILHEVNDGIAFGMRQAAKTRVGAALENYLELFFTILKMKYERQATLPSGEKLDLILPDMQKLLSNDQDAIMIECQTTLKDRFRLSLGKGNERAAAAKFIATLTGGGLVRRNDIVDLSAEKIEEIHGKHWRLVVLKSIADQINHPGVISYEEFVTKQYPARSKLW